jgi:hypothetical protein
MSTLSREDALIEAYLEGAPRAQAWGELRAALEERLEAAPTESAAETLRRQIAALAQEEAITRFVEDTVRFSLVRPRDDAFDDDEEF